MAYLECLRHLSDLLDNLYKAFDDLRDEETAISHSILNYLPKAILHYMLLAHSESDFLSSINEHLLENIKGLFQVLLCMRLLMQNG